MAVSRISTHPRPVQRFRTSTRLPHHAEVGKGTRLPHPAGVHTSRRGFLAAAATFLAAAACDSGGDRAVVPVNPNLTPNVRSLQEGIAADVRLNNVIREALNRYIGLIVDPIHPEREEGIANVFLTFRFDLQNQGPTSEDLIHAETYHQRVQDSIRARALNPDGGIPFAAPNPIGVSPHVFDAEVRYGSVLYEYETILPQGGRFTNGYVFNSSEVILVREWMSLIAISFRDLSVAN